MEGILCLVSTIAASRGLSDQMCARRGMCNTGGDRAITYCTNMHNLATKLISDRSLNLVSFKVNAKHVNKYYLKQIHPSRYLLPFCLCLLQCELSSFAFIPII